jgi:hypothetical protein
MPLLLLLLVPEALERLAYLDAPHLDSGQVVHMREVDRYR